MILRQRRGPFWTPDQPYSDAEEEVVDVAFVDDQCVIEFASSPQAL